MLDMPSVPPPMSCDVDIEFRPGVSNHAQSRTATWNWGSASLRPARRATSKKSSNRRTWALDGVGCKSLGKAGGGLGMEDGGWASED
jgi:hypothetical protein